ncbi:TetR/AcrR family transcriptional regulator [Nonomuraea candida]|uniref:TetR/AcrR family transcriptional regulator n=1 Tax=Nonomuraea candida TaxID=359159 RepID=UPI0006931F96|nr:TetR/AcrR family transcriptional regulator [Nonomuraea candida]
MAETGTRRGRPRAFDRDAVVEQATRLFWERGYEATSVGELTEVMGIRPGSLYATFGDKKSLFKEVVAAYGRTPGGAFMGRALEEETTAYGAFSRMLREAAEIYADPAHPAGCLVMCAAANVTGQDADIAAYLRDVREKGFEVFVARLEAARKDGELPRDSDPRALAAYFAAVLRGMSERARDGADSRELGSVAELALAVWPGRRS